MPDYSSQQVANLESRSVVTEPGFGMTETSEKSVFEAALPQRFRRNKLGWEASWIDLGGEG